MIIKSAHAYPIASLFRALNRIVLLRAEPHRSSAG
jgi:hypothetical protein